MSNKISSILMTVLLQKITMKFSGLKIINVWRGESWDFSFTLFCRLDSEGFVKQQTLKLNCECGIQPSGSFPLRSWRIRQDHHNLTRYKWYATCGKAIFEAITSLSISWSIDYFAHAKWINFEHLMLMALLLEIVWIELLFSTSGVKMWWNYE